MILHGAVIARSTACAARAVTARCLVRAYSSACYGPYSELQQKYLGGAATRTVGNAISVMDAQRLLAGISRELLPSVVHA